MIQIGLENASPSFLADVAGLRSVIRQGSGEVYIDCDSTLSIAIIAWASWAEGRRIVFAKSGVDHLSLKRTFVVISEEEMNAANRRGRRDRTGVLPLSELVPAPDFILAEFHTSGSSGEPICLKKTTEQLFGEARFLVRYFTIKEREVLMSGVPAHHLFGFLFSVMIPTLSGCHIVLKRPLHADTICQLAKTFDVDHFVSTPFQLRHLSASTRLAMNVFSSGAPLPSKVRHVLEGLGMSLTEIFGSTETGGIASRKSGDKADWIPFPPVKVRADAEGMMEVCSPFLETPKNYFKTQDRIEISEEGFLHLGRADDIVKVGGKRVSKNAIKGCLRKHDKVVDVAMGWVEGGRLHALVVVDQGVKVENLRHHLLTEFEKTILPKIHIVDALPRTALGKISRKDLVSMIKKVDEDIEVLGRSMIENTLCVDARVPEQCIYFEGHFDGFPILPGVAQLSLIRKEIRRGWPDLSSPKGIRAIKFKSPIYPDSNIQIVLERLNKDVKFTITSQPQMGPTSICTSGAFIHHD